jgi:hypothetical protein
MLFASVQLNPRTTIALFEERGYDKGWENRVMSEVNYVKPTESHVKPMTLFNRCQLNERLTFFIRVFLERRPGDQDLPAAQSPRSLSLLVVHGNRPSRKPRLAFRANA